MGTLANSGGRYSIYDVRGFTVRRQYEVLHWGHVDLQEYANGRFVSNNNIFTIVFFNTYYHKQINKILMQLEWDIQTVFRSSIRPYAYA